MSEEALDFCKDILSEVSRSFALTIPMLDDSIYKPVMITYLQDRLLDNFEDEIKDIGIKKRKYFMNRVVEIFDPEGENREEALQEIKNNADLLEEESLYRLTAQADLLKTAYDALDLEIKNISFNWLQEMNQGMQKYLKKEVKTFSDLDEYCYYVAGTVGGFLTEVIMAREDIKESDKKILKNNFKDAGLFLQKVNIVRDIGIDIRKRDKNYWPLVSLNFTEEELVDPEYEDRALHSLKLMLDNIKTHIQGLWDYYQALPESLPGYKKFFCVNNALGLATLEKMENNSDIFYSESKVKVPKFKFLKIIASPHRIFKNSCEKYI